MVMMVMAVVVVWGIGMRHDCFRCCCRFRRGSGSSSSSVIGSGGVG